MTDHFIHRADYKPVTEKQQKGNSGFSSSVLRPEALGEPGPGVLPQGKVFLGVSRIAKLPSAMNATTHAVFGVAALAGSFLLAGEAPPPYTYPAAVIAAWITDVDNPRSRLGNGLSRTKSPVLNAIVCPVSWALRAVSFVLFSTGGTGP